MAAGETIHTYPVNDLISHDIDGNACPCGPTTTPVDVDGGGLAWHVLHHSLDGREFNEPDYVGPPPAADVTDR